MGQKEEGKVVKENNAYLINLNKGREKGDTHTHTEGGNHGLVRYCSFLFLYLILNKLTN